jgi:hypothetical protein
VIVGVVVEKAKLLNAGEQVSSVEFGDGIDPAINEGCIA